MANELIREVTRSCRCGETWEDTELYRKGVYFPEIWSVVPGSELRLVCKCGQCSCKRMVKKRYPRVKTIDDLLSSLKSRTTT